MTTNAFDPHVSAPQEHPVMFWAITFVWVATLIFGAFLSTTAWWNNSTEIMGDVTISLGQTIVALELLWIAASIRILRVDEVGAVVLYGWPMVTVRRGPKLIVFGIFQLNRFLARIIQSQFPADPELVQKTPDEVPLETVEIFHDDGTMEIRTKVRPIRITTGRPDEKLPADDILNVQMTVEFSFWVRWIIGNAFLVIVNAGGEIDEVLRQMRDSGESLLNNRVTKMTPSTLIAKFETLQKDLKTAIVEAVAPWGIQVVDVGLVSPDLNHEVAAELRNIPKVNAQAKQVRTKADAEAYKLEQEGKGRGAARAAELAGEGKGYKEAAQLMGGGVTAEMLLQAQVARDTVGEADLVLGTDGIAQAVGIGKKIFSNNQTPKTEEK